MEIVKLKKEDFLDLSNLISNEVHAKCNVINNECFNTIWIMGEDDITEIYLKNQLNKNLIISRMQFTKQHKGIGTKVLSILKDYAVKHDFKSIVIESTCTNEILNFCNKHNFKPIMHQCFNYNGKLHGNYKLNLGEDYE